jgi:hypothetical protein
LAKKALKSIEKREFLKSEEDQKEAEEVAKKEIKRLNEK